MCECTQLPVKLFCFFSFFFFVNWYVVAVVFYGVALIWNGIEYLKSVATLPLWVLNIRFYKTTISFLPCFFQLTLKFYLLFIIYNTHLFNQLNILLTQKHVSWSLNMLLSEVFLCLDACKEQKHSQSASSMTLLSLSTNTWNFYTSKYPFEFFIFGFIFYFYFILIFFICLVGM